MGIHMTKPQTSFLLNPQEYEFVEYAFKRLSHKRETLTSQELIDAWSPLVDPEFVQHVRNGCFRKSNNAPIKLKPFAKHFYVVVNGNVSDKAFYIATRIFDNDPEHQQGVITTKVLDFVAATVRSYFIILSQAKPSEYESWNDEGISIDNADVTVYSHSSIKEIINFTRVSIGQIERWLCHQPLFMQLWKEVVLFLYSYLNGIHIPKISGHGTLPFCQVPDYYGPIASVLTIGKVMFINDALPSQCRMTWTPLFNSKVHGESFSRLVTKITHKGPTVLVVRDESGYVFGGFAPVSWSVGPNFCGDLTTTLFTLKPKMERYIASGHNNHYMYLNVNQQTIPNGLGMGGQYSYWGLWLDAKFVEGQSSETCSTFTDYHQMSSHKQFQIRHLEVWCVEDLRRPTISEIPSGSVLPGRDSRAADKFLLELSGREFRSDSFMTRNQ